MTTLAVLLSLALSPPAIVLFNTGGTGWGNACAVGPRLALTAFHVVRDIPAQSLGWLIPGEDVARRAVVVLKVKDRDLALVRLEGGEPILPFYTLAKRRPENGAPLTLVSVTGSGAESVWTFRAWVLGTKDGRLFADGTVREGMSGTCATNADGEVEGVALGAQVPDPNPSGAFRSVVVLEPTWEVRP